MKSNLEDVSLLDQYLKNQLDDRERSIVAKRLEVEDALREDYVFLLKVAADARALSMSEVWDEVKRFEKEYQSEAEPKVEKRTPIRWLYWRIAGILLLCIVATYFVFFYDKNTTPPAMYADVFGDRFEEEFIIHTNYRSVSMPSTLSQDQQKAFNLYAIKRFDKAIPLLETLWKNNKDTLALYYWGISELGINHIDKAEEIMNMPELSAYKKIEIK